MSALLTVNGLTIDFIGKPRQVGLIHDVSFAVEPGSSVALIGESGCGKSLTSLALQGLLPPTMVVSSGEVLLDGKDLLRLPERALREIRGGAVGMIFQDPMSSLNPTMTVGAQIAEPRQLHLGEDARTARRHAKRLLDLVGIPKADHRLRSYPFELSGGMQQRVMIAAAIACDPTLLIADEPTTALDVTIQQEILDLLRGLQQELKLAVLMVTHDLGVVADFCDDVVVMYAGHVVERAPVQQLFDAPAHPYTAALMKAVPNADRARTLLDVIPGRVPPAGEFPTGCRFQPRCQHASEPKCGEPQAAVAIDDAHITRCCRIADGNLTLERAR